MKLLQGLNSFRDGRCRIIYRKPSRGVIDPAGIGPRKYIYEATYRLVKKWKVASNQ